MKRSTTVSNKSDLLDALAGARPGETILLKSGDYGDILLNAKSGIDMDFGGVTIASANPDAPATITGLDVRGASGLTFDGITFDYTYETGDKSWGRPFTVSDSKDVTIRNSTFDGDTPQGLSRVDDGYGFGIGLSFRDSTGVTVENNEIHDFRRGVTITESRDIEILGNDVHSIRSDGLNFSQVQGVLIEDNHLHDFKASYNSGDHRDMIQFWTNGTDAASTGITIRGNHLDIGEGSFTQSIFMRNDQVDQGFAGKELFYRDVLIEENVIVNGHRHGITVGETDGLTIRSNTVLHADGANADGADSAVEIPRISVAESSKRVDIRDNVTSEVHGHEGQSGWRVAGNVIVQDQDPTAANYYDDVFLTSSIVPVGGVHDFRAVPGGVIDRADAGAEATREASGGAPAFRVVQSPDDPTLHVFEAFAGTENLFRAAAAPEITWTFADGTVQTGRVVTQILPGGAHDVTLAIRQPDGTIQTRAFSVEVAGPDILSFSGRTGFVAHGEGVDVALDVDGPISGQGLRLGDKGIAAEIDRAAVVQMLERDEFDMSMTLRSDGKAGGEIARLHGSFHLRATAEGELALTATTEDGARIRLETKGAGLGDRGAHDVSVALADGTLSITVDGRTLAETPMKGTLSSDGTHGLTFGNPWNGKNFEGTLTDFDITVDASAYGEGGQASGPGAPLDPAPEPPAADVERTLMEALETGVRMGDAGVSARIGRAEVEELLTEDAFEMSMTLRPTGKGDGGEVMRLHGSFHLQVRKDGELQLTAFEEDGGRVRLRTDGADLGDRGAHDVAIRLEDGILSISVDGDVLASSRFEGTLASRGSHDLTFGNPWQKDNFDGTVSDFAIVADPGADGDARQPARAADRDTGSLSADAGMVFAAVSDEIF